MKITQTQQETVNVLKVIDTSEIFSLYLTVDLHQTGSAEEAAIQCVYTEALFSGAGKYTKDAFIDALKLLGGSLSANIAFGHLTLEVSGLVANEKKIIKLFQTLLLEPRFDQKEIVKIKKLKVNQLELEKENSKAQAEDMLLNALFSKANRRYSHTEDDLIEFVPKVSAKQLKSVHKQVLSAFWNVSLAGNRNSADLIDDVLKIQTYKPQASGESGDYLHPEQDVRLKSIPSKQNIDFSIGATLNLNRRDTQFPAFVFGLGVLGLWGGFNGRLMSTVREVEGLTYGIYAQTNTVTYTEPGYWRIMTFFSPEQTEQGISSTLREFRQIVSKGITKRELERFKTIFHTRFAMANDSLTGTLTQYHKNMVIGGTPEDFAGFETAIANLSLKQVNQAIEEHLHEDSLQICGAGPVEKLSVDLKKLL